MLVYLEGRTNLVRVVLTSNKRVAYSVAIMK